MAVEFRRCGEGLGGRGSRTLQRVSRGGQEREAEHERRRGRAVSRASALRPCSSCTRQAAELVALVIRGGGGGMGRRT